MDLPADPLPGPKGLPSVATMLSRTPDAVRNVAFEPGIRVVTGHVDRNRMSSARVVPASRMNSGPSPGLIVR
jgi:hypothetical protein